MSSKTKKTNNKKNREMNLQSVTGWILSRLTGVYIFFMLGIYPLWYRDRYYDMDSAKWIFVRNVTGVYAVLMIPVVIIYVIACHSAKKKSSTASAGMSSASASGEHSDKGNGGRLGGAKTWIRGNLSLTDIFAIGYAGLAILSAILTPYKENVIWGYDGWYMGLVAQLGFVLIYFAVSRFYSLDAVYLMIISVMMLPVWVIGVLMRFKIDPLGMYAGVDEKYYINFISTLGQVTWYSSLLCIVYPVIIVMYVIAGRKWSRIWFGVYTAVCSMSVVTQNSDSAYMALGGIFAALFLLCIDDGDRFLRFTEAVIICLASFKCIGLMQLFFPDRAIELDRISVSMSQGIGTWILLAVVALLYLWLRMRDDTSVIYRQASIIRRVTIILLCAYGVGLIMYVILNSRGVLPENLRSENNYLLFDDSWGNNRGVSWRCAADTYVHDMDVIRKLFGAGPDGFAEAVYVNHTTDMNRFWGENTILTCAHNEWLNALINYGLLGCIAYIGIFVSAVYECIRYGRKNADGAAVYGIAIAVIAYMLHNFFCYQQIICTPIIFILMGMAAAYMKKDPA